MNEISEKKYWDNVNNAGEIKRHSNHPVVKFFSHQRFDYVQQFLDFNNIRNALDVGSGTGFSSYHLPSTIELTNMDFSLRLLRLNHLSNRIQASAYNLPFSSESFDLVYGWDFLHHLDEPNIAVREMARVSKKYLVLFEPNKNNPVQFLYAYSNKNERGTLNFDKNRMMGFVNEIDFKLITCDTVGWTFAGATPSSILKIIKYLPFSHKLGISIALICKKY